jgi:hypothetical protein
MCFRKTRVVCDTNVWYNISRDGYSKFGDILSKYQLVLTNLSLVELISTAKIAKDDLAFQLVKDAFIAIHKYAFFRADNDIEHMMNVLKIEFIDEEHCDVKEVYHKILDDFLNAKSCKDLTYDYTTQISLRNACCDVYIRYFNQQIEEWRKCKKQDPISVEEIRSCLIWLMKKDIYEYLSRHKITIKKIPFTTDQVDDIISTAFDLYLTAFSNFIFEKYKQHGSKMKANDYVDFRNLIYCHGNMKYLTFEGISHQSVGKMIETHCKAWFINEIDELRTRNNAISKEILSK